ncbi:MAG: branched-chain amino acid ABC transporter permease [Candidatus Liptonbacteria bacterium]|nr:branched-chain amino acid ABC transporter permease [Candidatus Liptonbacteria bacterium]
MNIIPQIVANSLIAGSIYALIALGFNLVYGATRFVNMVPGALAAIGGYTVFFLFNRLGLNIYFSVIAGVVVAGFFGYLSDRLVFRKLRSHKASNLVSFVASLGIFTMLQALISILFTSQFQSVLSVTENPKTYQILGATFTWVQGLIFITSIAAFVSLALILKKTSFGKAVRAVSDDEEVSKIIGINTNRLISWIFFIGSCLIGLSGIFIGFDIGINPTMGLFIILEGATASIIGGIGNVYGGFLGAFLLGFVENFGILKIPGEWKPAIAFGLLILFLIFKPEGIMNKKK